MQTAFRTTASVPSTQRRVLGLVLCLVFLVQSVPARLRPQDDKWVEVEPAEMDVKAITPMGEAVLGLDGIDWRHAQTEHFVIHYEQAMFARKVARMAEFFYTYIADDLAGVSDQVDGRSHIFVFRNEKHWGEFLASQPALPEWTFSLVSGPVMYLQKDDTTSSSGSVLAHETTHLIMNRFFRRVPPLWLNEGLAEYYGEFAYYAYKGVKRSKKTRFTRIDRPFPLSALLYMKRYPTDSWSVESFYETSKYLVAFLLLKHDASAFQPLLESLISGSDPLASFKEFYGYASYDDLEKDFDKFCR